MSWFGLSFFVSFFQLFCNGVGSSSRMQSPAERNEGRQSLEEDGVSRAQSSEAEKSYLVKGGA